MLVVISLTSCQIPASDSAPPSIPAIDSRITETPIDAAETPRPNLIVSELNPATILEYAKRNSCYLPLVQDSALQGNEYYFELTFDSLFNYDLPPGHALRNRYLVGDFNSLNEHGESRGISEIMPRLHYLVDFDWLHPTWFEILDTVQSSSALMWALQNDSAFADWQREELRHFYDQVWAYKTPPLTRKYSFVSGRVYASGQKVCLCEAHEDTLLLIAEFATSAKRLVPITKTLEDGRTKTYYSQHLPVGKKRQYYAPTNTITSKNWDNQRDYESRDEEHDCFLGGGTARVTYYKGKFELPNFLLIEPDPIHYRGAMRGNGIHEVALSGLSRGMLGTPNSIGCIRLSDFGSKFCRWWTPKHTKFFIRYHDHRYYKRLDGMEAEALFPFSTAEEGNRFRRWMHEHKPRQAKIHHIDTAGAFNNGYIIDAYTMFGSDYEAYLDSQPSSDAD